MVMILQKILLVVVMIMLKNEDSQNNAEFWKRNDKQIRNHQSIMSLRQTISCPIMNSIVRYFIFYVILLLFF